MPRQEKSIELAKWIEKYKGYHFYVKYNLYAFNACILDHTEAQAKIKIAALYPDAVSVELVTAFQRVHV